MSLICLRALSFVVRSGGLKVRRPLRLLERLPTLSSTLPLPLVYDQSNNNQQPSNSIVLYSTGHCRTPQLTPPYPTAPLVWSCALLPSHLVTPWLCQIRLLCVPHTSTTVLSIQAFCHPTSNLPVDLRCFAAPSSHQPSDLFPLGLDGFHLAKLQSARAQASFIRIHPTPPPLFCRLISSGQNRNSSNLIQIQLSSAD